MEQMRKIAHFGRRFVRDEAGSNAIEYGLIVGLISLAIVAGATSAGGSIGSVFNAVGSRLATAAAGITTP